MIDQERLTLRTESYLKSLVAEASGTLKPDFDSSAAFGELGVNSFQVLKIIKKLEADFGTLPKSLLFENFNIRDLAGYFVAKHQRTLADRFGEAPGGVVGSDPVRPAAPPLDTSPPPASPILILEKDAYAHPELKDVVGELFRRYKLEGSVSRGTRKIAPNLFIGSARRGYFHYGRRKDIVLFYGYTGPADYLPVIFEEVYRYCTAKRLQLNVLSDQEIPPVDGHRFSATPFGVLQRILNLGEFTLDRGPKRRLRYQVSRFQSAGTCRTEEYRCGSDPATDREIGVVIDRWCESRTVVNPLVHDAKQEILAGTLGSDHRVFLTRVDGVLQNVILITALSAEENGYLMDLEFYPPDMPLGGLEFAIVEIIQVLAREGCDVLSLGGTYGCKLEPSPTADPEIDRILDELRQQNIFNDAGNLQFKNKFRPENRTVYLCRPVGSGRPDTVIDIIMMIADPERAQTPIEDRPGDVERGGSVASVSVEPVAAAPPSALIEGDGRARLLADHGFNPLNLPAEHVDHDLKTDSWAQLEMPAIDAQKRHLHARLQEPVNVADSVRSVFPFAHFVLTDSGQAAEHVFFKAWPKRGLVLQNLLFPSTIFHSIDNGFTSEELPHPAVFDLSAPEPFKGNMAWEPLRARVAQARSQIACAYVDLCNNAAGGQPVSLRHLRDVKALLAPHAIPLVIDGTRVVDNARLLIERESGCEGRGVWEVVRDILSCADAVVASLTKDFCVGRGGIVATNDRALFPRLQALVQDEGAGIDLIDQKLVALALTGRKSIEAGVERRMDAVRSIGRALTEHGVPVAHPIGGHCVLIDVKRVREFRELANPVASFLAWLYLNTGIRGSAHSVGMQKGTAINDLVRLAVPIGFAREAVDRVIDRLTEAFGDRVNIPDVVLENAAALPGDIHARYELMSYGHVSERRRDTPASAPAAAPRAAEGPPSVVAGHVPSTTAESAPNVSARRGPSRDVAVVGMAGRYPKAKTMAELWKNLVQGKDCIEDLPADRLERRRRQGAAKRYRGGFIDDVDRFDSLFFHISPREAELLDPQERLFLEVAWEALEDAGYYPELLAQDPAARNVGVYVGAVWAMYQMLGVEEKHLGTEMPPPNSFLWSIANRVSYFMNLSGPSLTLDTACSSSLTALYLAHEAILAGECSAALVGGVNLDLHQAKLDINAAGGALSSDGVCRSFGKGGNGYVAGEGVGALFLKPLDQAVRDRDYIYGVIKSVVANHGGRTSGYTVPNPTAQASLIRSALDKAHVDARSLGYIEAHGTGTALGDPIEIAGLDRAFEPYAVQKGSCAIGSIKSNIGHLEAAAGIVGVSKVLLQMRHRRLAPSLHATELNEFIDFESSPLYVVQRAEEWKGKDVDGVPQPLRAGISSFGAGGSNAHAILEHYENARPAAEEPAPPGDLVFPLSARSEGQLRESAARLAQFLQEHDQDLRDVAFTLQVGRKSFDHRMAVVARTKEDLLDRLLGFGAGRESADVRRGRVKSGDGPTRLLDRTEREEFIRLLSQRRDRRGLAELWVEGLLVDWQGVPTQDAARRVPLPTYPFADERHWATGQAPVRAPRPAVVGGHPLIDSNESTFERQLFKKTFHDREFFLSDHHVAKIPTLPGVAYLELARRAGEVAGGRKVQRLRNVVWMSSIAVEPSVPKEVLIELVPEDAAVRFEVFSDDAARNRTVHCQGTLHYATPEEATAEPEHVDLAAVRRRCAKVTDGASVYPVFSSFGLDLGPSFRVLQDVYKSEDETLGELKLPEHRRGDLESMVLHPSLLDGSLQAGVAAHIGHEVGEMYVPFFIGEVEILHPLPPSCFSYVTRAKSGKGGKPDSARVVKSDVRIVDETGRVLVKINESTGVPLREVHKKPAPAAEADGFAPLYYAYDWVSAPLSSEAANPQALRGIVLFDTVGALRESYVAHLRRAGVDPDGVAVVRAGDAFQETDGRSYAIDPARADDFGKVFASLAAQGFAVESVCFAWPVGGADVVDEKSLAQSIESHVYSFLFLCQALIKHRLDHGVQLIYLFSARPGEPPPQHEAVDGFIKALRLEHPKLLAKTLEIDQADFAYPEIVDALALELQAHTQDATAVRYQAGERQVRRLAACDSEHPTTPAGAGVKEGGVYLITGGAGALGLIFGEFLAREHKAKLVLSGRSPLSAELSARLESLREGGAEAIYVQADVSKAADVARLVAEGRSRFGAIHGILHSAGVLRDSATRSKTTAEMSAVFGPKVFGTVHLDELTQDDELDFFVMFSSLTALGGNAGQCDYGFANRFMDSFAAQRERWRARGARRGKTLSVNWGLWASGGMKVGEEVERFFRNTLGMKPLSTATGLAAFVKGLALERSQLAVLEGVPEKLERAWGLRKAAPSPVPEAPRRPTPAAAESHGPAAGAVAADARLRQAIVEQLSKGLRMDPSAIPHDAPFADYGVNSVIGVEMVRAINEALRIDLDPIKLFEYATVNELTEYIATTWREPAAVPGDPTAAVGRAGETRPAPEPSAEPLFTRKARLAGAARTDHRLQVAGSGPHKPEPVAVIGMSGRFPESESLDELWEHLKHGKDLVREVTRWDRAECGMSEPGRDGWCSYGSFIDSIDRFDPSFFGISPLEARWMDPQQRLFLEEAWRALEDAGYAGKSVHEMLCGVYVGCGSSNYERLFRGVPPPEVFWGNAAAVIPARISYYLNLQGPAIAVDTASSSSLVAVHLACQGLWAHETEMALAGGVFLQATPGFFQVTNRAGVLSPDGKCYTFDARANGFVPGESVAVVVLKRLHDALRDGDHIHGVIAGSGVNQNGRSNGLIAPNARAQERLVRSVYDRFGIDPETIQVVEANGTGTLLGDSIEYQAFSRAFRHYTPKRQFCAIGSIATNMGHAATAAGVAGLLKVMLSLRHRQIPPALHFEVPNPAIDFESGPFYVNTQLRDWAAEGDSPRRGAVSSFGIGGTNAHVVVEAAPAVERAAVSSPGYLIVLSARSAEQLKQQASNLLERLKRTPEPSMNDLSYTLFVGRMHLARRLSCLACSREELVERLELWLETGAGTQVHTSETQDGKVREQVSLVRFGNHCIEECRRAADDGAYFENLATIGDLYLQGYSLDFHALFPPGSRRMPLPTYPFAPERYWIGTEGPHEPPSTRPPVLDDLEPQATLTAPPIPVYDHERARALPRST